MTMLRILVVEDEGKRRSLKDVLRHEGFAVCAPDSLRSMEKCIILETHDGAIIDYDLEQWGIGQHQGTRIGGSIVRNGLDISKLCHKINEDAPIAIYSAHHRIEPKLGHLSFPAILVGKPIPFDHKSLTQKFSAFRQAALDRARSHRSWLVKDSDYVSFCFNERIQAYKRAVRLNGTWLKVVFKALGEVSWVLIGDKRVELCGEALNGSSKRAHLLDVEQARYPDRKAMRRIESKSHVFPYPFWNMSKPEFVAEQFELAGANLSNYPKVVKDLLTAALAQACADGYLAGDGEALRRCSRIGLEGQIDASKQIFKALLSVNHGSMISFKRSSKKANLPGIVDVYQASVDKIDKSKSAGWVRLRKCGERRTTLVEPLDLSLLRENGVKYENQNFEYTVYKLPSGVLGMSIELSDEPEEPPFSFMD
jgi:hypothetical protein